MTLDPHRAKSIFLAALDRAAEERPAFLDEARTNLTLPVKVFTQIAIEQIDGNISFFKKDVTAAFDGYTTARASFNIDNEAVTVARETYRVQQSRYQAGATTILDLLKAQSDLDDAEAALVQARYATRLALAGMETILGRRLFPQSEQ